MLMATLAQTLILIGRHDSQLDPGGNVGGNCPVVESPEENVRIPFK